MITPKLKTVTRAALAALVIGTTAVGAAPAQAAGNNVQFGFSFDFGNGTQFHMGNQRDHRYRWKRICYTPRQVIRYLRHRGFDDIRVVRQRHGNLILKADYRRATYTLRVDLCDGDIDIIDRERNRRGGGRHGGGLHF